MNTEAWFYLGSNPNAITLSDRNIHKLSKNAWHILCSNPRAIHILENLINAWYSLSDNQNAIHMLEQNLDMLSRVI